MFCRICGGVTVNEMSFVGFLQKVFTTERGFTLLKEEQETTVNVTTLDELVSIWSSQPSVVRRLRSDQRFTVVKTGDGWVEVTIPKDRYSPITGVKRVRAPLSLEQRAALRDRLAKARGPKSP